jgi:ABC-type Fe3+ transport system permease subunit
MARIIHAFTDLCLALIFGVSIGASVAAATIFGVSREQGFDKHIANTLAGSMFDRLGWPMLVAALVATVGCLYAAKRQPGRASRVMAGAAVIMLALACLTQFVFAPRMADLRANSTWVNGELADEAERTEFRRSHGYSMAVSGLATLIAAGLIVGRRMSLPNRT